MCLNFHFFWPGGWGVGGMGLPLAGSKMVISASFAALPLIQTRLVLPCQ